MSSFLSYLEFVSDGFEGKQGHQESLANQYFLLVKTQKFPKLYSQKKKQTTEGQWRQQRENHTPRLSILGYNKPL